LRVLVSEALDDIGRHIGGLHELGPAIETKPGQARPVLVPALDQEADRRTRSDVADAG
jgi:hypothetical protein